MVIWLCVSEPKSPGSNRTGIIRGEGIPCRKEVAQLVCLPGLCLFSCGTNLFNGAPVEVSISCNENEYKFQYSFISAPSVHMMQQRAQKAPGDILRMHYRQSARPSVIALCCIPGKENYECNIKCIFLRYKFEQSIPCGMSDYV